MHTGRPYNSVRAILLDKDGTLFDFRKTWLPLLLEGARATAKGDEALTYELVRAGGYDPDTDRFSADGPIAAGNARDMAKSWRAVLMRRRDAEGEQDLKGNRGSSDSTIAAGYTSDPAVPSEAELMTEIDRVSRNSGVNTSVPVTELRTLFVRLTGAGITLGLATSDSTAAARAALEREGIAELFGYVAGYDSPAGTKPAASVATSFYEPLGLSPSQVMIVGDTWHDIQMARDCGCIAVAVLTGAVPREELEPYADVVLESIAELPDLIGDSPPA